MPLPGEHDRAHHHELRLHLARRRDAIENGLGGILVTGLRSHEGQRHRRNAGVGRIEIQRPLQQNRPLRDVPAGQFEQSQETGHVGVIGIEPHRRLAQRKPARTIAGIEIRPRHREQAGRISRSVFISALRQRACLGKGLGPLRRAALRLPITEADERERRQRGRIVRRPVECRAQTIVDLPRSQPVAHLAHPVELRETGKAGRKIVGLTLHLVTDDDAIIAGDLGDRGVDRREGGYLVLFEMKLLRPDRPLVGDPIQHQRHVGGTVEIAHQRNIEPIIRHFGRHMRRGLRTAQIDEIEAAQAVAQPSIERPRHRARNRSLARLRKRHFQKRHRLYHAAAKPSPIGRRPYTGGCGEQQDEGGGDPTRRARWPRRTAERSVPQ